MDPSIQVIRAVDPFMVNKIVSSLNQSLRRLIRSYFRHTDKIWTCRAKRLNFGWTSKPQQESIQKWDLASTR